MKNIVKQCVKGEESAQRELYMAFRVKWYMLCQRYGTNKQEADDIMQEGLIQIFKDLHQFDASKAGFATWSSRVMSHAALRFLKKNQWHQTLLNIEDQHETEDDNLTIYDQLAAKELTRLIQQLPIGYRIVFNMYVLEGYSHKEIGVALNISEGTSKSQLSKAKNALRQKLEFHLTEYSKK